MRLVMRLVSLFLAVIVVPACGQDTATSDDEIRSSKRSGGSQVEAALYTPGCQLPVGAGLDALCRGYEKDAVAAGHTVVGTQSCTSEDCFVMHHGEHVRVVFPDEDGPYPSRLFVWPDVGTMETQPRVVGDGIDWCKYPLVPQNDNLTILHLDPLNDRPARCKAQLKVTEFNEDGSVHHVHTYTEHWASNPVNGCLAWLECREDIPLP